MGPIARCSRCTPGAIVLALALTFAMLIATTGASPVAAQTAARAPRIGFLTSGTAASSVRLVEQFRAGLLDHGWVEGRNVLVEYRFAEGDFTRLPALANELVASKVELIVANSGNSALAAAKATSTLPIVAISLVDPVGQGVARSLARPGGNVTGLSYSYDADIFAKQLQVLKEAVPSARRIAVLWNPGNPGHVQGIENVKAAGRKLGLALLGHEARTMREIELAFPEMAREKAEALIVMSDPFFGSNGPALAEAAMKFRLPSMHGALSNVEAGGLLLYGPNLPQQARRAGFYVDRILKGARPGEMPFEHPTKFDLVINLRTAKALGLTIPPALLQRADVILE